MIIIRGEGVSGGVGMGALCFYRRAAADIRAYSVEDADAEWQRFKDAQAAAIRQLGELAEKARQEAGGDAALLFETHQMMAEDMDYEAFIEEIIRGEKLNAGIAVSRAGDRFAQMLEMMDDSCMRCRAADVRDVSRRILSILCGAVQEEFSPDGPVLLAADDLTPSETIRLDKSRILGLITAHGSGSSHTAILARAMGIPAVVGTGESLKPEYEGRQAICDGGAGIVVIDPDEEARANLEKKRLEQREMQRELERLKGQANVTKDGRTVRVCCNIGSPEEVQDVLDNDGDGVGLFRSEFLYLNSRTYPTEDEQFEAYKAVLSGMGGREVIIRTCDVGADKQIDYFKLPKEENPALGMRALRISLSRRDIFRTQLRALYRASVYGRLGILFPMVASVWEVRMAKEIIESVKAELREEGAAYSGQVEIGAMIETPAAAVMSDLLAKEVDFFSCGTNDLTQYTLACDRQNADLARFCDPRHPAVLRLIRLVVENAHKSGVRVGVCGELAADLGMTETFLAMGVDELSVPVRKVLPLRSVIRNTDMREKAEQLLKAIDSGVLLL